MRDAYTREGDDPSPEDWFRAHGFKPCHTHGWTEFVEGCWFCARFHDEDIEEVQIDGERFRRYSPVACVDASVSVASIWDRRPTTRYSGNSLNTQMSTGLAPSAEDEYFDSIEVGKEEVANLVYDIDPPEYRAYLDLFAEGATTREIAEELDVSQSTAVRKLNKAKRELRVVANEGEPD